MGLSGSPKSRVLNAQIVLAISTSTFDCRFFFVQIPEIQYRASMASNGRTAWSPLTN